MYKKVDNNLDKIPVLLFSEQIYDKYIRCIYAKTREKAQFEENNSYKV